jgi:hypothetical protein
MHKTKSCNWLRRQYRKNIFKNNIKIVNEIILLAEKLYPNDDYGDLDIVLERAFWFDNKNNTGVNLKIVGHGDDKWFDIIKVQDAKAKKAFVKLRNILNVKIKAEEKSGNEKQVRLVDKEEERILKNLDNDIAFWTRAKKADEEDVLNQEKPINNIHSEDSDKQLSFKFMEE